MKLNRNEINEVARTLPSRGPLRVAIIIGLASTYGREVLAGVGRYALIHGPWHLQLDYEFSRWQLPPWLKKWKGDGIISRIASREIKDFANKNGIPIVDLNEVRTLGLPYVYNDQAAVGRMAAEHLLEKEYQNFAFIGQRGLSWSDERASAFRETVAKLGGTYSEFQGTEYKNSRFRADRGMYRNSVWESETEAIREWVLELPKPVGIMSCNSFRGMQLLELCRSAGVAVPEAAAIVAGDNEATVCEITSPSLTAVELDGQTIGYHAADILHRAMQGKDISGTAILIPPRGVVARHSSILTAVSDGTLGKSLEFIRENYRYNIMPEDVSSHVNVSIRKLQLLFRKKLNCTIHDRILTFKLEMAMTLLRQTDLNLTEIAYRSGFNYPQQLSEAFLKKFKIRPGEYRKMNPPEMRFGNTKFHEPHVLIKPVDNRPIVGLNGRPFGDPTRTHAGDIRMSIPDTTQKNSPLYTAVLDGNASLAASAVQELLEQGVPAVQILENILIPAMNEVGTLFENNEYFVPELLVSARAMQEGMAILNPLLKESGVQKTGCAIIGTVKGDMHDIGKNLVASMLEGGGFEVIDLGVDVAEGDFVEAAGKHPGSVIALSALLTTTMPKMRDVILTLKSEGIRDRVKVIVGGAPVTQQFADSIGADGYSENANGAVQLVKKLVQSFA